MFEKAAQGLEQALEGASQTTQDGSSTSPDLAPNSTQTTATKAQDLIDLDKTEKFRYAGKEWTAKELEKAILRQRDYTQKTQSLTQERKSFESDQKFYDNLAYDIQHVLRNPSLALQFKSIYPEKFHKYVDNIMDNFGSQTTETKPGGAQGIQLPRELVNELAQMKRSLGEYQNYMQTQAVEAADKQLDAVVSNYSKKYPMSDEESVLARAQSLIEQSGKDNLSAREWETLFKASHEKVSKMAEAHYEKKVQEQKTANRKGKDSARGGGIVGEAPKRLTFKEATQAAIRDLTGKH